MWADEGWVTMGTEVSVRAEVAGQQVQAYIDLLMNDGGEPVIIDWKSGSMLSIHEVQALWYCKLLDMNNIPARRAEFAWLPGAKPETQRIQHTFSDEQLDAVTKQVEQGTAIKNLGLWVPSPSGLCDYCDYTASCSYQVAGNKTAGAEKEEADG
jgi:hypothetical protein